MSDILIKYIEKEQNSSGFDLGLLGESFSGFNDTFKELFEISGIQGELRIKTTEITHGSILVSNSLQIILSGIPFQDIRSFLDFVQIAAPQMFVKASEYFNQIGNAHTSLNDYFNTHEFDSQLFNVLAAVFFTKLISVKQSQENNPTALVSIGTINISQRYIDKLNQTIHMGKFKKALKPLIEDNISAIEITPVSNEDEQVIIDQNNFNNYLPEEEMILPDFENGMIKELKGKLVKLQSTRGEKMSFTCYGIEQKHSLLTAYPDDGKNTEDYTNFYKKDVVVKAEVCRVSIFKKPDIKIKEIELLQEELFNN